MSLGVILIISFIANIYSTKLLSPTKKKFSITTKPRGLNDFYPFPYDESYKTNSNCIKNEINDINISKDDVEFFSSSLSTSIMLFGTTLIASPTAAHAFSFGKKAVTTINNNNNIDTQKLGDLYDPSLFQPVCPASDGVYQGLKLLANGVVGADNVMEYGPLIASVLLRIRLELCVLESFLYEAVIPFVKQKGLSWVLPLHETVETFVAGTIFAIASNFILLGSTKIISVLFIYFDAFTGLPTRFIGSQLKEKTSKDSAVNKFGSGIKFYGDIIGTTRKFLEATDTFVGRYLVIATTIYISFKFAHFKLFNDII